MNYNSFEEMMKSLGQVPEKLKVLLEYTKKADLERYCKNLTIKADEFAALAHSSYKIGYLHDIKTFEYVPEHLKIQPGETFSPNLKPGQKLTGTDLKFLNKIKGIFDQRRHSIAHIFIRPERWHIFYFDFRDIEDQTENHWKGGSHIHFVNYLWANLKLGDVWDSLAGRSNKSYGLHIKWQDDRREQKVDGDKTGET